MSVCLPLGNVLNALGKYNTTLRRPGKRPRVSGRTFLPDERVKSLEEGKRCGGTEQINISDVHSTHSLCKTGGTLWNASRKIKTKTRVRKKSAFGITKTNLHRRRMLVKTDKNLSDRITFKTLKKVHPHHCMQD